MSAERDTAMGTDWPFPGAPYSACVAVSLDARGTRGAGEAGAEDDGETDVDEALEGAVEGSARRLHVSRISFVAFLR